MARLADPVWLADPERAKKIDESGGERGRAMRMRPAQAQLGWPVVKAVVETRPRSDPGAAIARRRPPARAPSGRGPAGRAWLLRGRRVLVVAEVELVEVGVGALGVEVDAGLDAAVEDEGVLVELDQPRGEDRAHERPHGGAQRLLAAGEGVAQPAGHALGAERLGPRHAVRVEHERRAPARDELGDAVQRVGVLEGAPQFRVDDRVEVARLAAAGVADGLLALGVGPAGAVRDELRM